MLANRINLMTTQELEKVVEITKGLMPGDVVFTNIGLGTIENWAGTGAYYEVLRVEDANERLLLRHPKNFRGDSYDVYFAPKAMLNAGDEDAINKAVFRVVQYKGLPFTEGPIVERFLKLRKFAV